MKGKLIILLVFAFAAYYDAHTQSLNLGGGVTTSTLGQKATNEIIERYNSTRPWLDKEMSKTNPFTGYCFFIGKDQGAFSVHLGVNLQKSVVAASGTPPGATAVATRELMVRSSFYSVNVLYDIADEWDENFGVGLNLGIALGGGAYYTRVTGEDKFNRITNTGYDGAGIFLGLFYEYYLLGDYEGGLAIRATPYYRGWPRLNITDASELLQELDPVNAGVPLENDYNVHHEVGLQLELSVRIPR